MNNTENSAQATENLFARDSACLSENPSKAPPDNLSGDSTDKGYGISADSAVFADSAKETADMKNLRDAIAGNATEEQRDAIFSVGRVLVSAAAGSGKTSTLIKRILFCLSQGGTLSRMLILVYNNAAADELYAALHEKLFEAVCSSDGALREKYRAELDRLPYANIGTIHSFCRSLLRENFEKADISPDFEVADEALNKAYMSKALDALFERYAQENDGVFEELAAVFSRSRKEDNLKTIIIRLYEMIEIQPDKEGYRAKMYAMFDGFENSAFFDEVNAFVKRLTSGFFVEFTDLSPLLDGLELYSYSDSVAKATECARRILQAEKPIDTINAAKVGFDKGNPARKRNQNDEERLNAAERAKYALNAFSDLLKEVAKQFENLDFLKRAHAQNAVYARKLFEAAERFEQELTRLKTADGVLSFSDLERLAAKLIQQEGASLEFGFDEVFVDEYQDVNPTEEFIISSVDKGRSFFVGDVKQSIYGFRLADPKLFLNRERRYKNGEGISLGFNRNFRSGKAILQFVNGVFDAVMTLESADVAYKEEARFRTESAREDSLVQLHFFNSQKEKKEAESGLYDICREEESEDFSDSAAEGAFIAEEIKKLAGRAKNGGGTIEYGDIAVLFRSRCGAAETIVGELAKRGIPLEAGGFVKNSRRPEDELVNFLRVIDNPAQDIPFAGFLLSFFGGYNEEELAEIAALDGEGIYGKFCALATCGCRETSYRDTARSTASNAAKNSETAIDTAVDFHKAEANESLTPPHDSRNGSRRDSENNERYVNQKIRGTEDNQIGGEAGNPMAGEAGNPLGGEEEVIYSAKTNPQDCTRGTRDLADRARRTLAMLESYRLKAGFKNVSELMGGIVSDFCYDAYVMRGGETEVYALKSFISQTAATDSGISLGKFLSGCGSRDTDAKAGGGNRVRVSTYHGFKGLEASVVFLANIEQMYSKQSLSGDLILDSDGCMGLNYYVHSDKTKYPTLSRYATEKAVRRRESKEEMRLFYVALTRARQYLYITGAVSKKRVASFGRVPKLTGAGCNLDLISDAVFYNSLSAMPILHSCDSETERIEAAKTQIAPLAFAQDDELVAAIRRASSFEYPYVDATRLSLKYSVSQLESTDEQTVRVFESAAASGTAYHRVMQFIDFSAADTSSAEAEIARLVKEGALSEEQAKLVDASKIAQCLSSDIMKSAAKSAHKRELPFMMYLPAESLGGGFASRDKVLVQGVIDLFIDGEEKVLVDFKNSALTNKETLEKYKRQLYLYKTALESRIGAKIDKAALYSFKSGKTVEFDLN
jgi:ATP-dependent exoDNAse (exonuclease V) beta subunit